MSHPAPVAPYIRPLLARDPHEPHRASTSLELLFDLVTVIAIAAAAGGLHHAVAQAHVGEGILKFLAAFFAIWWAWMNYSWFASAYDNDDVAFRLLTMVIMAGALTVAAGVGAFFRSNDLTLVISGYIIMRVAMVVLWWRASRDDPPRRRTARAYAIGIALVQLYWAVLLPLQPLPLPVLLPLLALGLLLELAVPPLAERHGITPWHRHHIMERYGLLTIIVLGESLLSASKALEQIASGDFDIRFVHIALSALVIVLTMWWLYFAREEHLGSTQLRRALTWGYGHVVLFAAGAAVGAGFGVLVDIVDGHAVLPLLGGDYAVAVPSALYLLALWFVRDRFALGGAAHLVLPAFALLVLLAPLLLGLEGVALVMALCLLVRSRVARRAAQPA